MAPAVQCGHGVEKKWTMLTDVKEVIKMGFGDCRKKICLGLLLDL